MSTFQIELTEKEWEIYKEIQARVKAETAYLTTLNQEQRLAVHGKIKYSDFGQ